MSRASVVLLACAALSLWPTEPYAAEFLDPAYGTLHANARVRYEHVDQEDLSRNADAITLRLTLGYETPVHAGVSALIEGEVVESLGSARYNSTTNRRTAYPIVVDPDTVELNQAYLRLTSLTDSTVVAGRQAINLGNQHFVGAVGFRQNQQTFDAMRISTAALPAVAIDPAP